MTDDHFLHVLITCHLASPYSPTPTHHVHPLYFYPSMTSKKEKKRVACFIFPSLLSHSPSTTSPLYFFPRSLGKYAQHGLCPLALLLYNGGRSNAATTNTNLPPPSSLSPSSRLPVIRCLFERSACILFVCLIVGLIICLFCFDRL